MPSPWKHQWGCSFYSFCWVGLTLPPFDSTSISFFFYRLQLVHLNPNSSVHAFIFFHLCEAFLASSPTSIFSDITSALNHTWARSNPMLLGELGFSLGKIWTGTTSSTHFGVVCQGGIRLGSTLGTTSQVSLRQTTAPWNTRRSGWKSWGLLSWPTSLSWWPKSRRWRPRESLGCRSPTLGSSTGSSRSRSGSPRVPWYFWPV